MSSSCPKEEMEKIRGLGHGYFNISMSERAVKEEGKRREGEINEIIMSLRGEIFRGSRQK